MLLFSSCGEKESETVRKPMAAPAFWVWHRTSALNPTETASLKYAGVRFLYWQVAECGWKNARWNIVRISPPMAGTQDLAIIPVFRIKPEPAFLGSPGSARLLVLSIRQWAGTSPWPSEIQLDFDCPARLMGNYTRFLQDFGKQIAPARVSITALASWPQHSEFRDLALSVSSLAPMFYDLEQDTPSEVMENRYHPMADSAVEKWIALWADCPRPWRVGLPNFERLSVFEKDGKLIGHLRGWDHDPVFFHPAMKARALGDGTTLFRAHKTVNLGGTEITPERKLVHRMADADALRFLHEKAKQSGASGAIYFALPGPGIQAAYSPSHLADLAAHTEAAPLLEFGNNGSVTFKNPGPVDLCGVGWELELTSEQAGAFRSTSPGGFVESATPEAVPAEVSSTIFLRFSKLPAGKSITSGALIKHSDGVRWKLRRLRENNSVRAE